MEKFTTHQLEIAEIEVRESVASRHMGIYLISIKNYRYHLQIKIKANELKKHQRKHRNNLSAFLIPNRQVSEIIIKFNQKLPIKPAVFTARVNK